MRKARVAIALLTSLSIVAACGDDKKETTKAITEVGTAEDTLNLIVWAGYAEDGSTYPEYDWVTPFETETGCDVKAQTAATSDFEDPYAK